MKRVSALLAALVLTGASGGAAIAAEEGRGLDWRPCEVDGPVTCATITVPVDWNRPSAGTIEVEVARTRATGRKQGTLVYLPGGPGDSGVNRLLGGNVVPAEVSERFDVVSYDPRGTNRSNPVVCDADLVGTLPETVPDAGATLASVQHHARELGDSCRAHTGPLVDHVDNVSVARDVEALRAALGERRITLYGRSYGTLAGQVYAENFPHRVRGLVLDSVFDHGLSIRELLASQARAGEDAFAEFATWCAVDPSCGFDAAAAYTSLWDAAVRGELPGGAAALNQRVLGLLYGPDRPALAALLRDTGPRTAGAGTAPFPIAAFCTDHDVRISSEREWSSLWRQQAAQAPTLRTHFAFSAVSLCAAWPADTPNPQHRTRLDDDVPPVLIMNSAHDPATPLEWARGVHDQVGGTLLTYDGWGHGVVNRTDCTRAAFTDYVLTGTSPSPGAHCPAAAP
ncbi:alpha/beta hydrolase [Umezawaea beigongshangensis]|uniref:alpha/beta hydrolase n=1 Tax=Umezawaea beigongshangensis TaxID=2780383 RepID=UPI0018F21CC9|nr:alpha/beta hydrolase [Umezawaea beigongshangensis]